MYRSSETKFTTWNVIIKFWCAYWVLYQWFSGYYIRNSYNVIGFTTYHILETIISSKIFSLLHRKNPLCHQKFFHYCIEKKIMSSKFFHYYIEKIFTFFEKNNYYIENFFVFFSRKWCFVMSFGIFDGRVVIKPFSI